jgi:hypothetical protein
LLARDPIPGTSAERAEKFQIENRLTARQYLLQ